MSEIDFISLNNLELTRLFLALVLLLAFAHCFGFIFQRFKMPKVIGEIFGGLVLGPSFFGFLFPNTYSWVFHAFEFEGKLISAISWIGLVLLMFISGFEIQRSFSKSDAKTIVYILLFSTSISFFAGWFLPDFYDFSRFYGSKENILALKIILGIAVAVTSIPVISKIFIDLGIANTRFAKIVITIATIEDIILWVFLAIATGIAGSDVSTINILSTVILTTLFFVAALFVIPRFIHLVNDSRFNILVKSSLSGYVLLICFFFAALASLFNINIVFGAFLAGVIVGNLPNDKFEDVRKGVKDISLAFFVPIYFAVVGLKLDLIHSFDIAFFFLFLLFVTIVKSISTLISARITIKDLLSCFNLAVALNARGGPGIVLATVALEMGIINDKFFIILVMVAVITSLLAGSWFRFLLNNGQKLMEENNSSA